MLATRSPIDARPDGLDAAAIADAFRAGTLPRSSWSHDAHLCVAYVLLREADGDTDLVTDQLRDLITAYNAHTGTRPDQAACHRTITRYYVEAIAAALIPAATAAEAPADTSRDAVEVEAILADPRCSRRAPLRHWTRAVLGSDAARHGWVEPDRAPLPWDDTPESGPESR